MNAYVAAVVVAYVELPETPLSASRSADGCCCMLSAG